MSKISIVTGGSRGIGRAIVKNLSDEGETLWQVSRTKLILSKVVNVECDLSELNFTKLKSLLKKNKPTISSLILNAGYCFSKKINETSYEDLEKIFKINVFANYELIKICRPYLTKNSKIILFSSLAGMERISKFPGFTAYAMTKACMISLCETLASEWPEIQIHCISPGSVDTEMFHEVAPKGLVPKFSADDVAKLCMHILSESKTSGVNWVMN